MRRNINGNVAKRQKNVSAIAVFLFLLWWRNSSAMLATLLPVGLVRLAQADVFDS